ncbi:MAG: hypothetical protein H6859_10185 [Rhodospirillales bacterium]|nr:hypothetical protein [Alphaproteobacteria bacterium]USO05489.1 MAG: hypothetical protein H6859_10185 [Rhodospirillales bacterium]
MRSVLKKLSALVNVAHQRDQLIKFGLLLGVLAAYFGYLSWEYDLATGGTLALLSWSFFVLCTPVADAGFLLDFPVRLITGVKMLYTEIAVWVLAFGINIWAMNFAVDAYDKTALTRLFHEILVTPWPHWGIIVLCGMGTFLSVIFGDEVLDVASHKARVQHHKHGFVWRVLAVVTFFGLIVAAYYHLIESLGIEKIINGG